jgi:hypothetical protein
MMVDEIGVLAGRLAKAAFEAKPPSSAAISKKDSIWGCSLLKLNMSNLSILFYLKDF